MLPDRSTVPTLSLATTMDTCVERQARHARATAPHHHGGGELVLERVLLLALLHLEHVDRVPYTVGHALLSPNVCSAAVSATASRNVCGDALRPLWMRKHAPNESSSFSSVLNMYTDEVEPTSKYLPAQTQLTICIRSTPHIFL